MGSIFGGGSSGGGGQPTPDTTTQFIREAPGIEERKIELMDIARQTAQTPLTIPQIQVQGLSPLEQAAITQAGQTGLQVPRYKIERYEGEMYGICQIVHTKRWR